MTLEDTFNPARSVMIGAREVLGLLVPGPSYHRAATRILEALVGSLQVGRLSVTTPEGKVIEHRAATEGPDAALILRSWRAVRRLLIGGDVAFAESYVDGEWTSPDLAALIALGAKNDRALGLHWRGTGVTSWLRRLRHTRNANTKRRSKRNIMSHYDLGNAFYRHWLDQSMTYSSALFQSDDQTLEAAQTSKIERIADLLDLKPGQSILEIGCGWGALAEHLASRHGCAVTGLTLSPSQAEFARSRFEERGLSDRAQVHIRDYREEVGSYDRIVSIEMLEAVGEAFWPTYFNRLRDRLKPGGSAVLQVITISERDFEAYRHTPDFIQRYVFPGGMLPSQSVLHAQIKAAGLSLGHIETFGASYARTLAEWNRRFQSRWASIAALGFDARFKRLWEFYLAYCQAGFETGRIDVALCRVEAAI